MYGSRSKAGKRSSKEKRHQDRRNDDRVNSIRNGGVMPSVTNVEVAIAEINANIKAIIDHQHDFKKFMDEVREIEKSRIERANEEYRQLVKEVNNLRSEMHNKFQARDWFFVSTAIGGAISIVTYLHKIVG